VTDVDVVVVGAGPGGIAAALTLADRGRSVVVVDKAHFPRDKICGDGLTALALRYYERLGLDPGAVASWTPVDACHVSSPSGRIVCFPLPGDGGHHAVIARRQDLDQAFVDHARSCGIDVREGTACENVVQTPDGVTVSTPSGPIVASFMIAADGMWSPVRRMVGGDVGTRPRGEWQAFRQYFELVSGPAADELWVWFDEDLLPGYAWSFPVGDRRVNLGFGVLRDDRRKGADLNRLWEGLADRPAIRRALGADAQPEGPHRSWPIPARITDVELVIGRVLFVGDAAGATDPMTGEGIGQALLTGVEAAEAIADGCQPTSVGPAYQKAVHHHLFADHRMAVTLGRLLARPLTARAAVRIAGTTAWTRRNFARWLFEDYPRAMLVTPRRWHRGMLTGPGAYAPPA